MKRTALVVVDNRLRVTAALGPDVREKLERAFTHKNPEREKADRTLESLRPGTPYRVIAMARAVAKGEPRFIKTWDGERDFSVPRGGFTRLRAVLESFGYELEVDDARTEGDPALVPREPYALKRKELRDYQVGICDAIDEAEQGLIRSSTGSGKSLAVIASIARVRLPSLIVVHRRALADQWLRTLSAELGHPESSFGLIGGATRRIRPITVGMVQTLKNCAHEYADVFGYVAMDEVHLSAAKTFTEVLDVFRARFRVGVSDDERRKDGKEFLIYDMFGERIAEVARDELVADGVIFDVEIRLVPTNFQRDWWDRTPETSRSSEMVRLVEEMVRDEERNRLLLELAQGETRKGERVLFFSQRVEHCIELRSQFAARDPRVGLMIGGKEHEGEFAQSLAGFMDGSVVAGFGTYQAIGPSIDLPNVGRGIAATPIHNNRQFVNQVRGRVCRRPEGKVDAILYYPFDVRVFGLAPAEKLSRIAKVCTVWDGDSWVPARGWIKAERQRRQSEE